MRQALGHASPKAAAGSGRPGQCKARHHASAICPAV